MFYWNSMVRLFCGVDCRLSPKATFKIEKQDQWAVTEDVLPNTREK